MEDSDVSEDEKEDEQKTGREVYTIIVSSDRDNVYVHVHSYKSYNSF